MKLKSIPINAPKGIAFAVTTHTNMTTAKHLTRGGGWYPQTGVITIDEKTDSIEHRRECRAIRDHKSRDALPDQYGGGSHYPMLGVMVVDKRTQ